MRSPLLAHITDPVLASRVVAYAAHAGQFRRDGVTAYVTHPFSVAERVKGNPVAEQVAHLHDVLEDSPISADDLRYLGFAPEVVEAVVALTKTPGLTEHAYLSQVRSNPLATLVKLADMADNLAGTPTEKQRERYGRAKAFLEWNGVPS